MASTYINLNGNASRVASNTRSLVDQARDMQENTAKLVRIMGVARDDVTDVDASFLTLSGLLGISSAEARAAYNLLVAFQAVINKAAYDTFIDRLG